VNKHDKKLLEKCKEKDILKRTYKNIVFASFFEKEVAQYLTNCRIEWVRNEKQFPVYIDGSLHYYVPDFYLPALDLYIEVKSIFYSSIKRRKTFKAVVDNNLNWIIIYLKEWKISKKILKERIKTWTRNRKESLKNHQ
jgi:hypothetical protein